jgi:hypothetical protein
MPTGPGGGLPGIEQVLGTLGQQGGPPGGWKRNLRKVYGYG